MQLSSDLSGIVTCQVCCGRTVTRHMSQQVRSLPTCSLALTVGHRQKLHTYLLLHYTQLMCQITEKNSLCLYRRQENWLLITFARLRSGTRATTTSLEELNLHV